MVFWKFHITATRAFEDLNLRHIRLKKPRHSSQESQHPLIQLDESAGCPDLSDVQVTLGPASKTIVKAYVQTPTPGPAHEIMPSKAGPGEFLLREDSLDITLKRLVVSMTETSASRLKFQDSIIYNSPFPPSKSFLIPNSGKGPVDLLTFSVEDLQCPEHNIPAAVMGWDMSRSPNTNHLTHYLMYLNL